MSVTPANPRLRPKRQKRAFWGYVLPWNAIRPCSFFPGSTVKRTIFRRTISDKVRHSASNIWDLGIGRLQSGVPTRGLKIAVETSYAHVYGFHAGNIFRMRIKCESIGDYCKISAN